MRRGRWVATALCLASALACDDDPPIYGVGGGSPAAADAELEVVSGNFQNGRTTEAFTTPLVVRAVQDLGLVDGVRGTQNIQPVEDVPIAWTITRGVATLSEPATLTDADGEASVTVTAGPLLGEIEVTATVAGEGGASADFDLRTTVFLIEILIGGFEAPAGGDSLEVVVGDTVEWVNRDVLRHAVVSTAEPEGGIAFDSGELANSERFRFVPRTEGQFRYEDPLSDREPPPTGRLSVVGRDVGALTVETVTTGENLDPAYVVTVDGLRSSAIGPTDRVTFPALTATTHLVRLVEVRSNCAVAGENPRAVGVVAGDTVRTTFQVACQ